MSYREVVERISSIGRNFSKQPLPLNDLTAAAVLIPLFERDSEAHLLFTLRTDRVRHHKGQISFPGGARDGDESLRETALRETFEEIGVSPADVTILSELNDMLTPTRYRVTPFVGSIPYPYDFVVNPRETEQLIEVPLNHLLDPACHRVGHKTFENRTYEVHYYDYGDHSIWGVTGHMIRELISRLQE